MYDRGRIVDETNGYQCELSKEYLSRFNLEDDDYIHGDCPIKGES